MSSSTASTPAEEIRASTYVGFDSITAQIEHKLLKRGFQFNVIAVGTFALAFAHSWVWGLKGMCLIGQTGLGKSTLINTIFASHLVESKGRFAADEPVRQTTEIHPVSHGAYGAYEVLNVF